MRTYGNTFTFGTPSAPHLFTCNAARFTYRDTGSENFENNEQGDPIAQIIDELKAELSFEGKITAQSTDFPDLSAGAAIAVEGIEGGVILCSRAIERWRLKAAKRASIEATHYPDIVQDNPAAVGSLSAFTPDQSALTTVSPTGKIIWGTYGFTHAAGIVQALTIEQQLTLSELPATPDGKIVGVRALQYLRRITLELLATGAAPAKGTTLVVGGMPAHGVGAVIRTVEKTWEDEQAKNYKIEASLVTLAS